MNNQIALDRNNDIIKKENGGIERVSQGRYALQLTKNKLSTVLGEWELNPLIGWINESYFKKDPDLFDIELRAKELILSVDGVQSINSISLDLSKDRTLNLYFEASTIYGFISLEVPWSIK